MKKRRMALALAILLVLTALPTVALPAAAASPYTDLIVESLYFTDESGLVQLDPIGKKGMVPRVALSKAEDGSKFSGYVLVEAYNDSGVLATAGFAVGDESAVYVETVYLITRGVYGGTAMEIPADATGIRAKYLSAEGGEQYGDTVYFNPAPAGEGYVGEITFPEPFNTILGDITISKEEGIRQYSTNMSADTIYDWSGATEIFLSTTVNYSNSEVAARTGTEKEKPITGRNFAANYKAGKYLNADGSVENDFIFTLVDDFYSGTNNASGQNVHTIPLNNYSLNGNLQLGEGVAINALIRSGAASGFTWIGSLRDENDGAVTQKWTKLEGTENVYTLMQSTTTKIMTCFNFETVDEYGIPRPYVLVDQFDDEACKTLNVENSIAACEATPGSFFQSADGLTIYCHPREGETITDVQLQWQDNYLSGIRHESACSMQTIVFENIGFLPRITGHNNNQFGGGDYLKAVYGFLSCKFTGSSANTLGMVGKYTAYLNECVAAYGFRDNYNYHAVQEDMASSRVVEVNCISYMNGDTNRIYNNTHPVSNSANSNNASTTHESMYLLRVGGRYFNSQGVPIGDGNTMNITMGIEVYDITYSPSGACGIGFSATNGGWMIDCYTTGTRMRYGIQASAENYVLDLCGLQKTGSDGRFFDLAAITWDEIAAGEWHADTSFLPDGWVATDEGTGDETPTPEPEPEPEPDPDPEPTPEYDFSGDTYNAVSDFGGEQGAKGWYYQYFKIGESGLSNLKSLVYQTSTTYWNNGSSTAYGQIRVNGTLITLEPGNTGDGALVFCAPKDGTVQLSMSNGLIEMQSGSVDGGHLKIFLNDTQIYPAEGWQYLASAETVAFEPIVLDLKEGDRIIFRANKGIEETSNATKNNSGDKFRLNPIVTYAKETVQPSVSAAASITVGATYGINIYLTPTGAVTGAGIKVGEEMLAGVLQEDGSYKVVAATAYARNLLGVSVTYYPYYTTAEGTTVATEPITASAKTLLETYVAGDYPEGAKALAQEALDYATVAEAYFGGGTVDTATADRLTAYDAEITAGVAGTTVTAGAQYTFAAVTLQLGDTINFIFAIGATDGGDLTALPEGCKITVDGTAVTASDFRTATAGGSKVMATVIAGVPEKEFASTLTFLLQDAAGNTLATLTYSVKDFCVRAFPTAGEADQHMIRAIWAVGSAAAAYAD